jgi:hypothetical protein
MVINRKKYAARPNFLGKHLFWADCAAQSSWVFPAPGRLKLRKTLQNKPDCNGSRRKVGRNEKREQTFIVILNLLFLKKIKNPHSHRILAVFYFLTMAKSFLPTIIRSAEASPAVNPKANSLRIEGKV